MSTVISQLLTIGDKSLLERRLLAVVGSSSFFGSEAFQRFSSAWQDWTVMSDMSTETTLNAQQTEIYRGRPAVLVLPCGIDDCHPVLNAATKRQVLLRNGLVVSKHMDPQVTPERHLEVNTLLAELCTAMLVVDGQKRSRAAHAARQARKLGKPVFAFPGPPTRPEYSLPNHLIRTGRAIPITCRDDLWTAA